MVTVRRIRPGDGPPLREVRLRALETDPDAFATTYDRAVSRGEEVWEQSAASASSGDEEIIFVAEADDAFLAMAGAFTSPEEPSTRHLYGMWVAPEARASGLGTRLAEEIEDWSRTVGAEEIELWVVEANHTAVRLYERAGFMPTGETQPLPSNPDLVEMKMRLDLT